jgi:hypothetical protein
VRSKGLSERALADRATNPSSAENGRAIALTGFGARMKRVKRRTTKAVMKGVKAVRMIVADGGGFDQLEVERMMLEVEVTVDGRPTAGSRTMREDPREACGL